MSEIDDATALVARANVSSNFEKLKQPISQYLEMLLCLSCDRLGVVVLLSSLLAKLKFLIWCRSVFGVFTENL